jgi:hypothetical protein
VRKRILQQILSGASDANVHFEDLRSQLAGMGFAERIRGDHHIFSKTGVAEILNLQPRGFGGETVSGQAGSRRHRSI